MLGKKKKKKIKYPKTPNQFTLVLRQTPDLPILDTTGFSLRLGRGLGCGNTLISQSAEKNDSFLLQTKTKHPESWSARQGAGTRVCSCALSSGLKCVSAASRDRSLLMDTGLLCNNCSINRKLVPEITLPKQTYKNGILNFKSSKDVSLLMLPSLNVFTNNAEVRFSSG